MSKVYISLGGNIGDKRLNFKEAEEQVGKMLGKIIQCSSVYETPPWGFHSEDNFWNRVLLIETDKERSDYSSSTYSAKEICIGTPRRNCT